MINISVLASGKGTDLQSVIDACEKGRIKGKVVCVISNKEQAFALERAKKHKIKGYFMDPKGFKDKNTYELELVKTLKEHKTDLVVLAGYMLIVGKVMLEHFQGKMINIHPALLPSFPGLNGQKQALEHGVKISGCTVHFVDEGCDTGPIILQAAVPVKEDDTLESLTERILKEEHKILPEAIRLFAEGKLKIEGRKVKIA